jgi:hypothetical protein
MGGAAAVLACWCAGRPPAVADLPPFLQRLQHPKPDRLAFALECLAECEAATRDCAALVLELVEPDDDLATDVRQLLAALDR